MLLDGNGVYGHKITSQNIYRNRNPPKYCSNLISSRVKCSSTTNQRIERIRYRLISTNLEVSPSSYDTAWVAMVPSSSSRGEGKGKEVVPCFPECLDWIMENQNQDGSWGQNLELIKDSLSCTLACLLALHKWNVGHHLIQKGLEFIGSNDWALTNDNDQVSPIGFDIIFPMMINYAQELDLALSFKDGLLDHMLCNRDSEINRNQINLGYVAEGIGKSFDWKKALKSHQRSNGSLFNSPATTAAALIFHCHDDNCFEYLHMVLKEYKSWVPTIYPTHVYTRLCMVDILERLGVDYYFRYEINNILQEIYRLWKEKDMEIIEDISCRALAFRLLRIKGYEVSCDELGYFVDQEEFYKEVSMQTNGVITVLELYRASQFGICEEEKEVLGKINAWTRTFLKENIIHDKQLKKQVEYDLRNFHGSLDRVGNRQSLELYDINHYQVLKTAYSCSTIYNEDILQLSRENFNVCQAQHQKELQQLERWYVGCKLDTLKEGRDVLPGFSHFLACAILPETESSDARLSYAKTVILVTCADDLFDEYGSRAESLKILELVKEWNDPSEISYCSQEVEIIFKALYGTVNELAAKAFIEQGRSVKQILINLWAELLTSFMRELDSSSTMDEYLSFAWISIGCKICIFTTIHFLGIKLSEDIIISPECVSLCKHVSLVTRLLNDIQTCEREQEENKVNSVSLQTVERGISEDEAISNLKEMIEYNRVKLLQLVFQSDEGSIVPRECKDLFWKTCKISHYLYANGDGCNSPQEIIKEDIKSLMYQPFI